MIDYLMEAWIEISILLGAVIFSRFGSVPLFILFYTAFMTITFKINNDHVAYLDNNFDRIFNYVQSYNDRVNLYNAELIDIYVYEGFLMLVCASALLASSGKLSKFTAMVVAAQSSVSFFYAMIIGLGTEYYIDIEFFSLVHSLSQGAFVVIYCLTSWMCAYYARNFFK